MRNKIYRLEIFPARIWATFILFLSTFLAFQCSTRDGDILSIHESSPYVSGLLKPDSKWNTFNFKDSTGSILCSITIDFDYFILYTGNSKDSLRKSSFDTASIISMGNLKMGKSIYYRLQINTRSGDSLIDTGSIKAPSGIPPSRPKILKATGNLSGILILWEPGNVITDYNIYRSEYADSGFIKIGETNGTGFFDSLSSFNIYWYAIAAKNQFGEGRCSEPISASKIIDLDAPVMLKASKGTYYHAIKVTWKPNIDAIRYNVYRADSVNGQYNLVSNGIKDSSYLDSVKTYSFFFYKVSSLDEDGRSGPLSSYDSGFSKIFIDPPVISDISEGAYDSSIYIYWNSVQPGISYGVYRSEDRKNYEQIGTTTDTFFVDIVRSSNFYYYEISSISPDSNEGIRSLPEVGYVRQLSIPQNLKILDNPYCIMLSWDSVGIADHYNIYRANDTDSPFTFLGTSETTHYCDQVLPGSIWYYEVSIVNKSGIESRHSNIAHGQGPRLIYPETITASQGTFQAYVAITWKSVPGATGYHLIRETPSSGYALVAPKIMDTLYFDSTASNVNYYRVCAIDSSGSEGVFSSVVTGYPAPLDTIDSIIGSTDIPNATKISWNTVLVADKYLVYRSLTENGLYIVNDTVNTTHFRDTTINAAYYKIAALYKSRVGKSSRSVFSAALQPPSNLSYLPENKCIRLSWNKSNGAISYNIYRSNDDINFKLLKNVTGFSYNDSVSDGIYYYGVSSVSLNGETSLSPSISVDYKKGISNLTVKAVSDTAKLNWSYSSTASLYQIYASSDPDSGYSLQHTTQDTFYNIAFTISGTYYFKIRSLVNDNVTSFSEVKSCAVTARPLAPIMISVQSEYARIELKWKNNISGEPASSFIIYRSSNYSSGYIAIDTVTSTTYSETPPVSGFTYYYKIAGMNKSGIGEQSDYLYGIALPLPAPQLLTASDNIYGTHISLTWSKVNEAESYIIARTTSSSSQTIIDTCSDTVYNDSTAEAGRIYTYYVASQKDSESSSWVISDGSRLPPPNIYAYNNYEHITLSWSLVANALKYYIYRSNSSAGPYVKIDSCTGSTYNDSVSRSGYFYYKMSSMNLTESEMNLNPVNARLIMPPAPISISASKGDYEDSVLVSWRMAVGANRYGLYRSTNTEFNMPILVATISDTFFYDHVSPDSFYYYRVKGINNAGESVLSTSQAMGFSIPSEAPGPVSSFSISNYSDFIETSWNTPDFYETPFKGFLIYRSESESGPFALVDTTEGTSYVDEVEKTFPSRYWYYVKSYNLRGESEPSVILSGVRQ